MKKIMQHMCFSPSVVAASARVAVRDRPVSEYLEGAISDWLQWRLGWTASMDEQRPRQMMPATSIRYVGIGQLTLYLVSDEELRMLESGGPSSTHLNLAIGFLSLGGGIGTSLLLSEPKSVYRFIVVIAITVGTLIAGFVLLVLWLRSSKDASNTIARIRARAAAPIIEGTIIESVDNT